jgi:hypothetical protein
MSSTTGFGAGQRQKGQHDSDARIPGVEVVIVA